LRRRFAWQHIGHVHRSITQNCQSRAAPSLGDFSTLLTTPHWAKFQVLKVCNWIFQVQGNPFRSPLLTAHFYLLSFKKQAKLPGHLRGKFLQVDLLPTQLSTLAVYFVISILNSCRSVQRFYVAFLKSCTCRPRHGCPRTLDPGLRDQEPPRTSMGATLEFNKELRLADGGILGCWVSRTDEGKQKGRKAERQEERQTVSRACLPNNH